MEITKEDFLRFRDYFYRKTGIYFEESKRYFVDKRLEERAKIKGCADFRSYFNLLRFDRTDELQAVINLMTVNETYFFRESYQLDCLVNSMMNEVAWQKRPGQRIRIWSLPCSTGEEPYSIALSLLERWKGLADWDVEILASDIDTQVLNRSREGIYDKRSLQHVPEQWLKKYFRPVAGGSSSRYQLIEDIRESVGFSRVNLYSASEVAALGKMDVVFCRNLLIYFDDLSRRQAAERLFDALNPGGFICLGHSESMSRISPLFKVRKFPDALVYQK
ncbi:chemotaxis protein methyltransferase CheR [Marinospirillum celere]|uniref:Chemotaxis protein methyltransferase n=1 Tax=Marinospirillum celere TaxID=1122252 RepID=A0A1I1FN90_9GAMM|nr:protein-glutamate O-methyltransferase CheR [Marinospirillum celere]SFC00462.1 chemotaxis protein methyltransferase CheR [Marinospirillum celere]